MALINGVLLRLLGFLFLILFVTCATARNVIHAPEDKKGLATVDSCNDSFSAITVDDSPQKTYFEKLLKRGMKANIREFLKLWYPKNVSGSGEDTYFFECQQKPWGPLLGDENHRLSPKCRPDVLYSWGSDVKLKAMQDHLPDGQSWSGSANRGRLLYTALTPATTYAYGPIQIRFKIRPQVVFNTYSDVEQPNEIEVRTLTYQEFNISDAAVIESWSYGTPEQYDEIVRDILRISSGKRAQGYYVFEPKGIGFERFIGHLADGLADNEETLKQSLLGILEMILNGKGRIHYAKKICRNRKLHFSTSHHSYFHPN